MACGTGSSSLVKDHQRTTERHTPQPARVSLAELRDLLEPSLRDLWLDLCIRTHCGAEQRKQRQILEMAPNLHRPPLAKGSSNSKRDLRSMTGLLASSSPGLLPTSLTL